MGQRGQNYKNQPGDLPVKTLREGTLRRVAGFSRTWGREREEWRTLPDQMEVKNNRDEQVKRKNRKKCQRVQVKAIPPG